MPDKPPYAARLEIGYSEQRNRFSTLLRFIYIIPILVVLALVTGGSDHRHGLDAEKWKEFSRVLGEAGVDPAVMSDVDTLVTEEQTSRVGAPIGGGDILATAVGWLSILLTGRYPRPIFDYVVGVGRWALRVETYAFLLLTDDYPAFSRQRA